MRNEVLEANLASLRGTLTCDEIVRLSGETYLKAQGKNLRGRCPIHRGESPSFFCYADEQRRYTSWHCHRCNQGGDVIDLYAAIYGPFSSLWHTVLDLADRFGLKLWEDRDFYTENQRMVQRSKREAKKLLDRFFMAQAYEEAIEPYIAKIPDEKEREKVSIECMRNMGLLG